MAADERLRQSLLPRRGARRRRARVRVVLVALLTWLDLAAALHTVAMEEEDLRLVPLAILYRFFFIATVDVAKLFATLEELLHVKMSWGKLERAGRI